MISFSSLLIVGAVAVAVPLLLGLVPVVKVPGVVLEILGGILVGPTVLGWVHLDVAVRVISDLGLGFLLFLAGFEIDLRRFDRRILILVSRAFVVSVMLALLVAYGLQLGGQVKDGLLVGITLALAFSAVAEHFGLATILGAFLAGVIVRRTDETPASQHEFQGKLEAIGFGFLIPVFFVSTGAGLDIAAMFRSTRAIILVPVFLVALLVVRGLPALLYVRVAGRTRAIAAGFMQATSLTFIVVATVIGVQTNHQRPSTAAALVVAGLLSVVIYPPVALRMLKSAAGRQVSPAPPPEPDPS